MGRGEEEREEEGKGRQRGEEGVRVGGGNTVYACSYSSPSASA